MPVNLEHQPLSDLRVIDLTHGIAGPYCTKLLADFGADVIKVEKPDGGDFARTLGPFPQDIPHAEKSGLFLHLNSNKRGVVLDLKTPQGMETVKELVRDADILVESFRPGVIANLGLDYETLSQINPNLVMTSISNFGQTGPYRDYQASEFTLFAMGGFMNARGLADRYPITQAGNHVQYQAGNVAAMATSFAWYAREHSGMGGQWLDISIHETQMGSAPVRPGLLVQYQYTGERNMRQGLGLAGGYPSGYFPCKDGYVNVSAGRARWPQVAELLGMPELLNDPRFTGPEAQADPYRREEFEGSIWLPWLLERTKREVVEACQGYGLPSAPVNTIDEVMNDNPQLEARGYFLEVEHPVAGKLRHLGAILLTDDHWWRLRSPAPLLGQHTQEILAKGWGDPQKAQAPASRATHTPTNKSAQAASGAKGSTGEVRLPLEGIRVLDMTMVAAGPYGAMLLADMGAEVIRLEPRHFMPLGGRGQLAHPSKELEAKAPSSPYPNRDPGERPWNRSASFNAHARNKSSITVDLTTPEGKDVFRRLVQVSDMLVQNNAVGSMERLGFSYDAVSKWNPRFSMISVSGLGQTGPWRGYRGMGYSFESFYGWTSLIGYPDMDAEGIPIVAPSDASTAVTIAMGAVMALRERERTGKGSFIDISLGETFMPHIGELFTDYLMNGRVAGRLGNRHLHLVQGVYPCAGLDEWITLSIDKVEEWHTLCRLMGRPELIEDERFADMQQLHAYHDAVDQIISEWTKNQDSLELFHGLQQEGIPAGPVMHEPMAYADPHLKERGYFVPITQADAGTHQYPGTIYKMSKVPFVVRKPPVRLGEDNDYVYREVLALTEEEYDHLKAQGHIGTDYAAHVQ